MMSKVLLHTLVTIVMAAFLVTNAQASTEGIAAAPEQVSPLLPGLSVPNITLKDQHGNNVELQKRFAEKTTVLIIYRGGWCPYCSKQLANIQKIEQQLANLNAQIIAVSPDSPEKLAQSKISSPNYLLLSDDSLTLTKALGLAYFLDDKTAAIYRNKRGVNFVDAQGKVNVALPVPAVFVIDKSGVVYFQYANPNYKVRLTEELLLAGVKSIENQ
ncbi:peroxiredoxin-like family protein [Pseudoalteromonas agarivorans]|uniref:peroxiredoxin-like family protein n=1 Tax=Pseudoalteromonas agarivorans TaxID=176102 RepID=UPI0003D642AF|nr:alkyl hydroperoxide reductase [Pseudoalteromonas agarivorans]|tara:strand:- start:520 stop:1164 length:645 start_codon:yes stop_codon:yes gene_type:complete